jgi:hypothetical protein
MGSLNIRWQEVDDNNQRIVKEIHKVVVHRFQMGDVEDPDLYAAQPMYDWEKSEAGQFVMKHAEDAPEWHRNIDHTSFGYQYAIVAELEKKKLSEFYLRFDKTLKL